MIALVRRLRGPEGCPWDRAQSTATLAPFLVEEAFEVLHAVENRSPERVAEEAGDLAFVLSLFLEVAEEEGPSTLADTLSNAVRKIQARHPHVFGPRNAGADSTKDVLLPEAHEQRALELDWERLKQSGTDDAELPLDATASSNGRHRLPVPHPALPALAQSAKLQAKAANLGFDWPTVEPVVAKVREELDELEAARRSERVEEIREELGDLLFAVVNLARFLRVEPESALRAANEKFRGRFHRMLDLMAADGTHAESADLALLDAYWDRVKREERG